MNGHHLVLGELTDVVTGEVLPDTLDERDRQRIARLLLFEKGFRREDIAVRRPVRVCVDTGTAEVPVDFLIHCAGRIGMLIQYGPGSVTTRQRSVLALSRLVAPYQVPLAVATNGRSADLLDGFTGRATAMPFCEIPDRVRLEAIAAAASPAPLSKKTVEMATRIFYAMEVDGACPCDTTICRIPPAEKKP